MTHPAQNPTPDPGVPRVELPGGASVPGGALSWSFTGSSGPGGQNVNKRATKAVLRVVISDLGLGAAAAARLGKLAGTLVTDEGELVLTNDESRSQAQNKRACLERLGGLIAEAKKRPKVRKKTKPSKGAVQRRIDEKKKRGETKRRRQGPIE